MSWVYINFSSIRFSYVDQSVQMNHAPHESLHIVCLLCEFHILFLVSSANLENVFCLFNISTSQFHLSLLSSSCCLRILKSPTCNWTLYYITLLMDNTIASTSTSKCWINVLFIGLFSPNFASAVCMFWAAKFFSFYL